MGPSGDGALGSQGPRAWVLRGLGDRRPKDADTLVGSGTEDAIWHGIKKSCTFFGLYSKLVSKCQAPAIN